MLYANFVKNFNSSILGMSDVEDEGLGEEGDENPLGVSVHVAI